MATKLHLPDTDLCLEATALATGAYEPFLLNHCLRAYLFADALGRRSGMVYDRELLYVACLLHDLGLSSTMPVATRFEVEGADAARAFLQSRRVGDREQEVVWDAIALHTTPVIPQRKGPEVALCQRGVAIDAGSAPTTLLPPELVADCTTAYPRLEFKEAMLGALCGLLRRDPQAAASSPTVAAVGQRLLPGFGCPHVVDVIRNAAFEE